MRLLAPWKAPKSAADLSTSKNGEPIKNTPTFLASFNRKNTHLCSCEIQSRVTYRNPMLQTEPPGQNQSAYPEFYGGRGNWRRLKNAKSLMRIGTHCWRSVWAGSCSWASICSSYLTFKSEHATTSNAMMVIWLLSGNWAGLEKIEWCQMGWRNGAPSWSLVGKRAIDCIISLGRLVRYTLHRYVVPWVSYLIFVHTHDICHTSWWAAIDMRLLVGLGTSRRECLADRFPVKSKTISAWRGGFVKFLKKSNVFKCRPPLFCNRSRLGVYQSFRVNWSIFKRVKSWRWFQVGFIDRVRLWSS
jgi:hypothetical protein